MKVNLYEINISNNLEVFLQNNEESNKQFLSSPDNLSTTVAELAKCLLFNEEEQASPQIMQKICDRLFEAKRHHIYGAEKLMQCAQRLLETGEIQKQIPADSLHTAAKVDDLALILEALQKEPTIERKIELLNRKDHLGQPVLYYAVHYDERENYLRLVAEELIKENVPLGLICCDSERGRSLLTTYIGNCRSNDKVIEALKHSNSLDQVDEDGLFAISSRWAQNTLRLDILFKTSGYQEMGLQESEAQDVNHPKTKLLRYLWHSPNDGLSSDDTLSLLQHLSRQPKVIHNNPSRASRWLAHCLRSGLLNTPEKTELFCQCVEHLDEPGKSYLIYRSIEERNQFFIDWAADPANGWSECLNRPFGPVVPSDKPEERERLSNLTPLNLALSKKNISFSRELLNKGCSPNTPTAQGESTLKWLISNPSIFEAVAPIVPQLVEKGADLQTRNQAGKNALEVLLNAEQFATLEFLVASGIELHTISAKDLNEFLERLLVKKQYGLFELVVKKAVVEQQLIAEFSPQVLTYLCKMPSQLWLQRIFSDVHQVQFDLRAALQTALREKNFHLAAFLVAALGVETPAQLSPEIAASLNHFAELLNNDQLSETKRALLSHITNKNLAHLFGDAYIKKLRDRGEKVEGNHYQDTFAFTAALLDYAASLQDPAKTHAWHELKHKFAEGIPLAKQVDQASSEEGLEVVGANLQKKFDDLAVGSSFLIPYGWARLNGGHAALLECHKIAENEFAFLLFNTGEGIGEFHEMQVHKDKPYANVVRAFKLSADDIRNQHLSTLLLEPSVMGKRRTTEAYGAGDIYHTLSPFQVSPLEEKELIQTLNPQGECDLWMQAQLGGTCAFRSLLAFMRFYLGKEAYKEILKVVRFDLMDLVIEAEGATIKEDAILRKILSKTIPHFATHALKELKQTDSEETLTDRERELATAGSQLERAYAYFPKKETALTSSLVTYDYETVTESLKAALQAEQAAALPALVPTELPSVSSPKVEDIRDAASLATYLQESTAWASAYKSLKRSCVPHMTDALRELGRVLLEPDHPTAERVWASLEALSKEELQEKYLNPLGVMSESLYEGLEIAPFPDPAQKVALYTALFVAFKIARILESKDATLQTTPLSKLFLNSQEIRETFKNPNLLVFDPTLIQDMQRLLSFPLIRDNGGLFDFKEMHHPNATIEGCLNNSEFINKPYLELNGDDWTYAQSLVPTFTEEESQNCKEDLRGTQNHEKMYSNQQFDYVDPDKWNATWAYVHKAPPHFALLRQMALWVRTDSLWTPKNYHMYGPSVGEEIYLKSHSPRKDGVLEANVGFALGGFTSHSDSQHPFSYTIRALDPNRGVKHEALQTYGLSSSSKKMLYYCQEMGDSSGELSLDNPFAVSHQRGRRDPFTPRHQKNPIHEKHLFFNEATQHEITAWVEPQLAEALASRIGASETSVTSLPMLLDLFLSQPELIKQQKYRMLLYLHLFKDPLFLEKHFVEYPFLQEELPEFFVEMEKYLESELEISAAAEAGTPTGQESEKASIIKGLLIVLDMHQRALKSLQKVSAEAVTGLEELRQRIRDRNLYYYLEAFHQQVELKAQAADAGLQAKLQQTLLQAYRAHSRNEIIALYRQILGELRETAEIDCTEEYEALCRALPNKFIGTISKQYLSLALLDSYHLNSELSPEQVKELLSCAVIDQLNMTSDSDYRSVIMFPHVRFTAQQSLVQWRSQIESVLRDPQQGSAIVKYLFSLAGIPIKAAMQYDPSRYPLILFRDREESFELDIRTGTLTHNHQAEGDLSSYYQAPLYVQLFKDKHLEGIDVTSSSAGRKTKEFLCDNGRIRLVGQPTADAKKGEVLSVSYKFEQNGDSKWYQYSQAAPIIFEPLTAWKKSDAHPAEYLYLDPETFEPKIVLNAQGQFVLLDSPEKRFELADLKQSPEGQRLLAFHPDARLWREVTADSSLGVRRLELPGYHDEGGKQIEFVSVIKDGQERWALKSDPKVLIAQEQTVKGLLEFPHALVLENEQDKRTLLIPKKTWHQFTGMGTNPMEKTREFTCLAYPLENGVPQTRNSIQHTLFLAYLSLAQAETAEDYLKVFEQLKLAARFDSFELEDLRLLGWMFNCSLETTDHSVQAQAVSLFIHWMVEDNRRRNPTSAVWNSEAHLSGDLPSYHGPAENWTAFWNGQWTWKKLGKEQKLNLKSVTEKLLNSYKAKIGHLESQLMLNQQIDRFALQRWSNYSNLSSSSSPMPGNAILEQPTLPAELQPLTFTSTELDGLVENATSPLHENPPEFLNAWRLRADNRLEARFDELYKITQSGTPQEKNQLRDYLFHLSMDSNLKNFAYRLILETALKPNKSYAEQDLCMLVARSRNASTMRYYIDNEYPNHYYTDHLKALNKALQEVARGRPAATPRTPAQAAHLKTSAYTPPPMREPLRATALQLPSTVPTVTRLSLRTLPEAIATPVEQSYAKYFKPQLQVEEGKEPVQAPISAFTYTPSEKNYPDPAQRVSVAQSIQKLNRDYQVGANKNLARPSHELKESAKFSKTIQALKKEHGRALKEKRELLAKTTREMLALANRPPSDRKQRLLRSANLIAGHKKLLNESECEALYLQADQDVYAFKTNLEPHEIDQLHQLIGQYVLLSREADHFEAILKGLETVISVEKELKKLPSQLDEKQTVQKGRLEEKMSDEFQSVADLLNAKRSVSPKTDPPALMVFEHRMGVYLRPEQVEKLRKALPKDGKFPDIILQLIQGGGKTFVFGHILALLKADGYHLSVHVAPTAQYKTTINDMRFNSNRAFGQKEHTFEFDDQPEYFTEAYLNDLEYMLKASIVNKDYVTVTKETLRAMRGKYLRTRRQVEIYLEKNAAWRNRNNYRKPVEPQPEQFRAAEWPFFDPFAGEHVVKVEWAEDPPGTDDITGEPLDIVQLEKSNKILERILTLMDERGVFTFDEIHIAGDPYEELNMPTGAKEKIDFAHANLIAEILLEAAAAKKADDTPLLALNQNQQSQQKEEEFVAMKAIILDKLLDNPTWQKNFGLRILTEEDADLDQAEVAEIERSNQERHQQLKAYISGEVDDLPDYLHDIHSVAYAQNPKAATAAQLVILARQMLSEEWLKNSLQLSVSEHHGFPSEECLKQDSTLGRVSIPYIANMTPADGSEFSDRFVVITNTFISYAVVGLTETQVKHLAEILLKESYDEYITKRNRGEEISLKETQAYKNFKAVTGLSLHKADLTNPNVMELALKGFRQDTTEARELLFYYATKAELSKVNFFTEQIATHGQNTFGIGKSSNGYSGSLENPNIKPFGADLLPEEGTNGQSIDLLVRKNDDLWVVGNQPEDLFVLFKTHPQKERIRAIIDIGCQFRGIPNKKVALQICKHLDAKSPVKGVLYFDNNELYFMQNKGPEYETKKLTGTKKETIKAETGCDPEELFTYYDQDHITGVDIVQASDALAIGTASEHTQIHEILQGFRRLRRADFGQRIAFAVQKGALTAIGNTLEKEGVGKLPLGKIDSKRFNIHDLILFGHLNEVKPQPDQDHILAIQKMEELVQKAVMRKMAKLPLSHKRIAFSNASYLFVKNIGVDLYRDYALKKTTTQPDRYYPLLGQLLIKPLQYIGFRTDEMLFTPQEYADLKKEVNKLVKEAIQTAKKEIPVPKSFEQASTSAAIQTESRNKIQTRLTATSQEVEEEEETLTFDAFRTQNRGAIQTQVQEQQTEEVGVQRQEQLQKTLQQQKQVNRRMIDPQKSVFPDKSGWELDRFVAAVQQISPINPDLNAGAPPEIWNLNALLSHELKKEVALVDPRIQVTSNFAMTFMKEAGLLIPPKSAYQALIVGDPETDNFKIVLCLVKEAQQFDQLLRQAGEAAVPVRLCGVSGRLLAQQGVPKTTRAHTKAFEALFERSQLRPLFLQLFFLNSRLDVLSNRKYFESFKVWLADKELRAQYREFFKAHLAEKADARYPKLRAYHYLCKT